MPSDNGSGTCAFSRANAVTESCETEFSGLRHHSQPLPPTLTQEKGIDLSGVDLSDTSQLSSIHWAAICSQLKDFPKDFKPLVSKCSEKMRQIFDAAETECPKIDDAGTATDANANKALCQTLTTMVRLHASRANGVPEMLRKPVS